MTSGFELFDHTADLGVRAHASSLPELVAPCTEGLYAVVGDVVAGDDGSAWSFESAGDDPAVLLRDYLAEVLLLFEQEHQRLTGVHVLEFGDSRLHVVASACPVDTERSAYHREVKAVTYHELAVRQAGEGYEATYIVDI